MWTEFKLHNDDFHSRFLKQERKKMYNLIKKWYDLPKNIIDDIYQESCIAFYKNFQEGKLSELTCSVSSYFTSICINQARKFVNGVRDDVDSIDDPAFYSASKISELLDDDGPCLNEEEIKDMHDIVALLPPPCEQILWGFYRDRMSMEEIAEMVDYANAQTAKAKKSQCLSKLIKTYKERIKNAVYGK